MLCEDYAGRTGGVPDLIIWNAQEGVCKFVEVKGPGDTVQENQKVQYAICNEVWFGLMFRHSDVARRTPSDWSPS